MTIYTVIGYREDYYYDRWEDRSRSEFEIQIFDNEKDAIEQIFEFRTRTERMQGPNAHGYNDWESTLLIDGKDEDWWFEETRGLELENPFFVIRDASWKLYEAWKKEANEREAAKKKAAEDQKKREKDAAEKTETAKEKALLKKLKEKYPEV